VRLWELRLIFLKQSYKSHKAPLELALNSTLKIKKSCDNVVLTMDNIAKRNGTGSKHFCFCLTDETIKHLFFKFVNASTIIKTVTFVGLTKFRQL
jgi:hypothetical protein